MSMGNTGGERDRIRLSLDVSPELNDLLSDLAEKTGGTKSDVLRKAITLMGVAVEANEHGGKLTIVEPSTAGQPDRVKEVIGLLAPKRTAGPNDVQHRRHVGFREVRGRNSGSSDKSRE